MRISDWSSDVCSSDLRKAPTVTDNIYPRKGRHHAIVFPAAVGHDGDAGQVRPQPHVERHLALQHADGTPLRKRHALGHEQKEVGRSEEHTSELQSLMRISYAVFCLKKKIDYKKDTHIISKKL